jgi:hypothetical protein
VVGSVQPNRRFGGKHAAGGAAVVAGSLRSRARLANVSHLIQMLVGHGESVLSHPTQNWVTKDTELPTLPKEGREQIALPTTITRTRRFPPQFGPPALAVLPAVASRSVRFGGNMAWIGVHGRERGNRTRALDARTSSRETSSGPKPSRTALPIPGGSAS